MRDEDLNFDLSPSEFSESEVISCELANGHSVKIVAAYWSRWRTYEEWASNIRPEPYFALRIYCTENTLPKRLSWMEEFSEETDFAVRDFAPIWHWLGELCSSRRVFEFDGFTDFLDHVSEGMLQFSTPDLDAVEHLKRLPEISNPQAFDQFDDSIFNDQNDSECG